jgi:hypothetical protein
MMIIKLRDWDPHGDSSPVSEAHDGAIPLLKLELD